jgi:C4-dicarboxylate-specific signal transduction histidine kinase
MGADRNGLERRVLVAAPTRTDVAVSRAVLARAGLGGVVCTDTAEVCRELERGAGAVGLSEGTLSPARFGCIADWFGRQPPWSDLPVVLQARGGPDSLPHPGGEPGNVIVLDRPVRVATLVSVLRSALRARERQYQIRDLPAERERAQEALRQAHAGLERRVEERTAEPRETQAKALRAERLAAIGQMVTGLAHESRNALQRCQSCLSVLGVRLVDRPELTDLLDRMQAAQDDLHRLFNEVRDYAAPISLDLDACDLAAVWRQVWEDLEPLRQGRGASLVEASAAADTRCLADAFRLKQVFRNLLENALGAGADPVRVVVACAAAELDGREAVRVAVRDNGPGFAGVDTRWMFEPFVSTKVKGTGLGLAICKRVVEAQGGPSPWATGTGPVPKC